MSVDIQYDEYRAFLDRIPQIGLMVRDILLNPAPTLKQPDGEWNDEYDRMQQ